MEGHLGALADAIYRDWQQEAFTTLALSGPVEAVARLEDLLHNDLHPVLARLSETTRAVMGVADTLKAQDELPPARPIAALLRF